MFSLDGSNLKGAYILLEEPSVTGTANILMAAVLAEGRTTIYNAACEPYVQQLCHMLNRMGARISGIGSNMLTIEGVEKLHGCEHRMLADMIEVGSFIGLAAMTQSELTIKNADVASLGIIPDVFQRLGIELQIQGDDIYIPAQQQYRIQKFIDGSILTVYDHPWPGFTPDLLSIILVTATQAKGTVLVHQKMFESRLFFVDKLIEMGTMSSPDIRAGVALLIAALSAKGKSVIQNIDQIDRGYERIDQRLNALGADIRRIDG
jgi:UDP-N-acetylglucosamine 1-carboxyvinyltransferase